MFFGELHPTILLCDSDVNGAQPSALIHKKKQFINVQK